MDEQDFLLKILLTGDIGTGKSSIFTRYSENKFTDSLGITIGVEFKIKRIQFDNLFAILQIWDIGGEHCFRNGLGPNYRGTNVVLVVFDKSNKKSFDNLDNLIEQISRHLSDHACIFLVGNKSDLKPKISMEEIVEKAFRYQLCYIEVSAKTGDQIELLFELSVRQAIDKIMRII